MNKKLLKEKILKAWGEGLLCLDEDMKNPEWGFVNITDNFSLTDYLNISMGQLMSEEFNEIGLELAAEIRSYPLIKALS